jgi:hypothetical protein
MAGCHANTDKPSMGRHTAAGMVGYGLQEQKQIANVLDLPMCLGE